jgi:hypothetical protein
MHTDFLTFKAFQVVARKVACLILGYHCLASQHIKGELNAVSDLLSFKGKSRGKPYPLAFDSPNDKLLPLVSTHNYRHRFHRTSPSLDCRKKFVLDHAITANRRIICDSRGEAANEKEDRAWLRWLTFCESSGMGHDPFLTTLPNQGKSSSSSRSSAYIKLLCGISQVDLSGSVLRQWSAALYATPQAVWLRPFGTITSSALFTSKDTPTCFLLSDPFSRPTRMSAPQQIDKKQSPQSCYGACTYPPGWTPQNGETPYPPQPPASRLVPSSSPSAPANSPRQRNQAGRIL